MPGALMQLVAYGAQDVYLTGNPQMTFWKAVYKRHTNFAMESIEQVFNGQGDFGSYVQCVVARNGDLIHSTYLVVTLPEIDCCWSTPPCWDGKVIPQGQQPQKHQAILDRMAWILGPRGKDANWARWIDYPGENLIDYVEVEIGGTVVDKHYGEWMHIWNQLTLTDEKREGYNKMIGHTTELTYLTMGRAPENSKCSCCKQLCEGCKGPCNTCAFRCNLPETTLYIPLLFWFCRNPGLALPLIALQYHEVKINVQLRDLNCLLWAVDSLSDGGDPLLAALDGNGNGNVTQGTTSDGLPPADPPAGTPITRDTFPELLPKPCGTSLQAVAGATTTLKYNALNILVGMENASQGGTVVPGVASRNNSDGAYTKHLVTCSLFIDYIFLDRDERRYMAQNPHQYLIEQVQFNDTVSTAISENTVELDFNHPCKEIFLTTQQEYFRDCCKQFEACEPLYKALGIQPFNYTDCIDAMPPAYQAFHGPDFGTDDGLSLLGTADPGGLGLGGADPDFKCINDASNSHFGSHIIYKGLFRNPGAAGLHTPAHLTDLNDIATATGVAGSRARPWMHEGYANGWMHERGGGLGAGINPNDTPGDVTEGGSIGDQAILAIGGTIDDPNASFAPLSSIQNSLVSDAGAIVLAKSALNMHCWGKNPIYRMVLQLNGQDRFSERAGKWFDLVQPFKYHTHLPDTGINLYSFALKPEDHNPSGTLNFSRIDNANLRLTLSNFMFNANNDGVSIKVYATNYNILRIMSGMGGLAYSN